ncbi:MAG: response regulator [Tissierellia bacterium]|nr:response regulator [Tissierellia bacterium]
MKLLLVDDSKFSQITASNLFKKIDNSIEIILASDGKEGFEKYKRNNPDYIIVDLLMPKICGNELIKVIKEYDKDANIIVLSADVQNKVREEIMSYGVKEFINKPLNENKAQQIYNIMKGENHGER